MGTHHVVVGERVQKARSGARVVTAYTVTCEECGPVGPLFVPTESGLNRAEEFGNYHASEES